MGGMLFQAFVYLCAAVIAVPVAKRLGLGSVLGYLVAGIVIGPVFHVVGSETEQLQQFAEFGVVMMLFVVGLEVKPQLLWQMRARLLGLGGLQVLATAGAIAAIGMLLLEHWQTALAAGLVLSLSSTAIVLQTLSEKGLIRTDGGQASFAVLLLQDIAVIPMLALIPLLAVPHMAGVAQHAAAAAGAGAVQAAVGGHGADMSLVAGLSSWAYALVVLGAMAAVVLGGHFLSRPLFRFIASSHLRESFTATALLLVVGIALLMTLVDLSPALGTFLAGVVLADSEFRHELESDIEPFKGLLLGLFFITVGAGIDFGVLRDQLSTVLALTLGVMAIKGALLFVLGRLFRLRAADHWLFALSLAQVGELGFVLLAFSTHNAVIAPEQAKLLSLVIALSMLLTPVLFIGYECLVLPRLRGDAEQPADAIDEQGTVIIAGGARFGQVVNRLLMAAGVRTVVLDHDAAIVELMRRIGIGSYFGDASRPDLLRAAGIEQAQAFVVAIDDRDRAVTLVEYLRREFPRLRILARAFDVDHLYLLRTAGADVALREVFDASLELGAATLRALGRHPFDVEKLKRAFRKHDMETLEELYELWDRDLELSKNRALLERVRARTAAELELTARDRTLLHDRSERGWTPPPRGYTDAMESGESDDGPTAP
ncbi:MAG: cation:proton antiporter [Thiohalocapsa sp.]|jgi:monovalent cation:proton antiporter-2 (CPA2) family protein|uniref:cation:proton antiporter domain-containing protein n=1 Tax=Thiohalocapsa sp. TaxID=2497641 RepID=UPI0025EF66B5|nr:cation:proton antiporter [Thiohalocapsa sp.]MCG6942352.1 cation:proton antiporter [Thiohalocapsa sp.]